MKIYIAGKITGDKNYKKKFAKAERILRKKGHSVMNPAQLIVYKDFTWFDYMMVSGAMQRRCWWSRGQSPRMLCGPRRWGA